MDLLDDLQCGRGIAVSRRIGQSCEKRSGRRAQQTLRFFLGNVFSVTRAIFEHIERVTHTALREAGDQLQRAVVRGDRLALADGAQSSDDGVHCHAVEIKALAT